MDEYDKMYRESLKYSAAAHLAALGILLCVNFVQGCLVSRKPPEPFEPMEFTVAIPDESVFVAEEQTPEPENAESDAFLPDEKTPEPVKTETVKTEPLKRQIQISTNVVTVRPQTVPTVKPVSAPPPPKVERLTQEEINRLFDLGAIQGERTSVPPNETQRNYLIIKQTLYSAWQRPALEYDTGRGTEILIKIGVSGVVLDSRITRGSGNPVFDESVKNAVAATGKFNGLTKDFITRYEKGVTVLFKTE